MQTTKMVLRVRSVQTALSWFSVLLVSTHRWQRLILSRPRSSGLLSNCHFINPIACYGIHNILVDSKMICTKPLSPLPYCSAEDMYGLDGLFSLKMPDPETESGELVNTHYTLLYTFTQVCDGLWWECFTGRDAFLRVPRHVEHVLCHVSLVLVEGVAWFNGKGPHSRRSWNACSVVPKKLGFLQEIYKIQSCRPPQERNDQVLHKVPPGMVRGAGAQGYHSCGSAIWQAILWVSQASCGWGYSRLWLLNLM